MNLRLNHQLIKVAVNYYPIIQLLSSSLDFIMLNLLLFPLYCRDKF